MELDKRIKEGKRPLTCFDTEQAKKFLGKECYLSNDLGCFCDLNCSVENKEIKKAELTNVSDSDPCYEIPGFFYDFCLPCEWVKEPEKKYRPFSLEEFLNIFHVGDLIHFRRKNDDEVKVAIFTGYITDVDRIDDKTPGAVELMLGSFHYSLFSLFDEGFEVFFENKWQPFGVIEDD